MSKIRFLNVPRKVRSLLNGRRLTANSKPLDLITANQRVKALAKELDTDQKINLDLEIEPDKDKKQVFTVSNVYIEHDDQQLGLRRVADRIVIDSNVDQKESKNRLKLADLIEEELKNEHSNSQDVGSDIDYMFTEKEEKSEQIIPKESEKNEEEKNDDQRPLGGVAPQDIDDEASSQKSSSDKSDTVHHETTVESSLTTAPNPISFMSNNETKERPDVSTNFTKSEQEVVAKSEYIAEKNLFQAVPDKNAQSTFDLQGIKKRLGYVDDPKDKYQQKLNRLIDRDIEKCHLKNAANEFEKAESKLKRDSINELSKSYDDINQFLLTETVDGQAGNELKENQAAASQEKADNEQVVLDKQEAKNKELSDEATKRIAEATERITTEIKHRKDTFNQEQDHWLEKRENQIDDELKQKNLATKEKYRAKEVQRRNSKLEDIHQQVENSYSDNLNKLFIRHKNSFATNVIHLERSVQTQANQIDRWKQKEDKQQVMLDQQKAKTSAITRSNELKEQELAYRKKHDQQFPEELAKTLSDGVSKAIREALADQQKAIEKGKEIDLQTAIVKHLDDQEDKKENIQKDKEEDISKNKKKHKHSTKSRNDVVGVVGGALAALLLALSGYEIYADQFNKPNLSELAHEQQQQRVNKSKTIKKSQTNTAAAKPDNQSKTKKEKVTNKSNVTKKKKPAVKAGDSNVVRYRSTNSWSAKVDVLDGALGQGDIRALKEINDYHSTWISRLYYAIAANDQSKIRSIYLKITPEEKQELSAAAKHSIALAFYNVHDWNNGWKAKNGY